VHRSRGAVLLALSALLVLAACEREKRQFEPAGSAASAPDPQRGTSLRPGTTDPVEPGVTPAPQAMNAEENAYSVAQGKRLFRWYNCSGCHAQGGGDIGPPLMDDKWLYGSTPAQIFASITQGRPNGMPAFGGRIPEQQMWQIVAYVRSLSGQLRKDVAPSRGDNLSGAPPENERDQERPVAQTPASAPGATAPASALRP
jgi:cytochrome c oxidase cbb3-type subunit 3